MDQVAYPKKLTIALTDRCNLKCFICWRDEFEQSQNNKGVHMDFAHLGHMENAIRHAEMISLTGFGESFLYPRLHEVLDRIYALNPRDNLIMLISNGTALSYEHGRKLGRRLRELVVSLNAANPEAYQRDMHPEVNRLDYAGDPDPRVRLEKLNGRGLSQFDKTCGKIREFLRGLEPEDRRKVRLHYVVHRDNIAEMEDFVLVARELGCSTVGFYQYMVTQESRIDYSIFFHKETYNESFDRAQNLGRLLGVRVEGARFGESTPQEYDKEHWCTSPFDEAIVYTNGAVAPCCHAGSDNLGNAFATGFDAIWFGQQYRKLREERHLDGCHTCKLYRPLDDAHVHFHPLVKTTARYKEVFESLPQAQLKNPLKVLVVGAGADGSRSLWTLIKSLHGANNAESQIQYLVDSYAVAEAAMRYVTNQEVDRIATMLNGWQHEIIVGNNFGFFMPVVRDVFGPDLKIINLKRSREAAVRALIRQAELYPQNWGGYVSLAEAHDIVRPTARHFKEMDAAEWARSSLAVRIGWYYDKNHALIEAARADFPQWLDITTEELSAPDTIARIGAFINPAWKASAGPVHLNAGSVFDLTAVTDPYDRIRLARVVRDFNLEQALASETYPIGYFVEQLQETPLGRLRSDAKAAKRLQAVRRRIEGWIEAAEHYRPAGLPMPAPAASRRIRNSLLSPERQITLERLFHGFDIRKMAADETYAATFFVERLVSRHSENPAMYASLVGALQPISNFLRDIIVSRDPTIVAEEQARDQDAVEKASAA